jgi:uncharacterized FAD-dependent dehydrogenase
MTCAAIVGARPTGLFAALVHLALTKPVEDTTACGMSIARRSTEERIARNPVKNTLRDVTPGDISMALPQGIQNV